MQTVIDRLKLAAKILLDVVVITIMLGIGLCLFGFISAVCVRVVVFGYNLLPI